MDDTFANLLLLPESSERCGWFHAGIQFDSKLVAHVLKVEKLLLGIFDGTGRIKSFLITKNKTTKKRHLFVAIIKSLLRIRSNIARVKIAPFPIPLYNISAIANVLRRLHYEI